MHRRIPVGLTALLLMVSAGMYASAEPTPTPGLRAIPIEGKAVEGDLVALDGTSVTVQVGETPQALPLGDLTSIQFAPAAKLPRVPRDLLRVTLTGGEEILGQLAGADEEALAIAWAADVKPLRVPFEVVRHVESLGRGPASSRACARPALRYVGDASDDVVWLRSSGDRVVGTLVTSTKDTLTMEDANERTIKVAWANVLVCHLVNDPLETPSSALRTRLEDHRGSRFWLAAPATFQGGELVFALRSVPKQTLRLPVGHARSLEFSGARFVYASDLPFEGTYEPYHKAPEGSEWVDAMQVARWQPRKDLRSDDGCPLRIGDRTYRNGFYAHSRGRITIELAGGFATFRTTFGLLSDDPRGAERNRRPDLADVDARILADGKELWSKKGITHKSGAVEIGPLKVEGVQKLVLEVDYGKNLDVCDDVAWVDPILVRK